MAFFNKRGGGGRGRGGKNFNNRNPNKIFGRNPNRPGGIRKNNQDFSQRPLRPTNRPLNKRGLRGRRRNEGTNNNRGRVPRPNNGKFKTDNLDRDLDKYWGKDHPHHQETRAKILNDDLDSYWEKKPSKTDNELTQTHENRETQPHQEVNNTVVHAENTTQAPKKKIAVDSVPL